VVLMLCAGLIHGDLSEYNVLVAPDGPVIIDFPQVVNAAGNNAARDMLLRDVGNITATLARFAPDLASSRYGEEMWELFERGELRPDSVLTGIFIESDKTADVASIELAIADAREEALRRQRGRDEANAADDR
jgi:RIO kinase 1